MGKSKAHFIEIKNLKVHYTSEGRKIHAVNDVSFSLKKGETLGLVGETGAGKTTIAKSILRILPEPPAQVEGGEIFLEGEDLLKMSNDEMRKIRGRKIAMIFQDPMSSLNPVLTVIDQVSEAIRLHERLPRADAVKKAVQILKKVGIQPERVHEYPHQFSGGMKQRVVIAMALACSPQLLIADEPTTALDVTIQAQVLRLIRELRTDFGTSMLLITHDLGIVAETCDQVAVIYAGEIVEIGSLEDIFDYARHPYTQCLFASIPSLDKDVERLQPITGPSLNAADLPQGCSFYGRCPQAAERCGSCDPEYRQVASGHFVKCLLMEET